MGKEELVYGRNNVMETLKSKKVAKVYVTNNKEEELFLLMAEKNVPYTIVDKNKITKLCKTSEHQNVAAVISPISYLTVEELILKIDITTNPLLILVDEVTDVNNLGAMLRSIDAFGASGLIFNKKRNAQITAKVAHISTGAVNHVDVARVTNLSQAIKKFKQAGYFISYLDMDGEQELNQVDFTLPLVVIVGGEDKGVTANMKRQADFGIKIPMVGHVNSLNVATAVGILCYEKNNSVNNERRGVIK